MAKLLGELVDGISVELVGEPRMPITGIASDSRKVEPGNLFVPIRGFTVSGEDFIAEAVCRGAVAVAVEEGSESAKGSGVRATVRVKNCREFLALAANRFYDHPSRRVKLIGVTGTNGKTTVTYLIRSILRAANEESGLIGTIGHFDGQEFVKALNTTPESLDIVRMLDKMRSLDVKHCVMEVSSHAIALSRVAGLDFYAGVFTNLTQDHLDFHKTLEEYRATKLKFIESLAGQAWAICNRDDATGREALARTRAQTVSYGWHNGTASEEKKGACISGEIMSINERRMRVMIRLPDGAIEFDAHLIGRHNVYNLMAAAGVGYALGLSLEKISEGLERLKSVPGRMERVENDSGLTVFVDYAHSPDALANLLRTARMLTNKRLIVVFGCGGNRDEDKRPKMGRIATELADRVIVTSDNPRKENPKAIIDQIVSGAARENFEVLSDRRAAIKRALQTAHKGDVVLIAGKGHEDYQIIGSERYHFDDRKTVRMLLKRS